MTSYRPEDYQRAGIRFLIERDAAGLFADPGAGKTAMTLAAFSVLRDRGVARRALIVAPRLVCSSVWPEEIAKWEQFSGLRAAVIHGDDKAQTLFREVVAPSADVCLVNPEAVEYLLSFFPRAWFERNAPPVPWPWDLLVVDESSKFKNPAAVRFRALKQYHRLFKRRVILTGTPAPNGLHDLWSQVYLLDSGDALGKTITEYRKRYFDAERIGNFTRYTLKRGAGDEIMKAIAPLVMRFDASTFATLPELLIHDVPVTLPPKARALYDSVEGDLFAEMDNGGDVIAATTAANKYALCRQIANGRYYHPETHEVQHAHSEKIEAVRDLVDELQGKPALIAYYYRHDLEALREAFLGAPVIGAGVSDAKTAETIAAWNRGALPVVLVHPDSMAHGLNLQAGGNDLIMMSLIDSLENYQQLIKRLHRRGVRGQVRVHRIISRDTVDRAMLRNLNRKAGEQSAILDALREYRRERTPEATTKSEALRVSW